MSHPTAIRKIANGALNNTGSLNAIKEPIVIPAIAATPTTAPTCARKVLVDHEEGSKTNPKAQDVGEFVDTPPNLNSIINTVMNPK